MNDPTYRDVRQACRDWWRDLQPDDRGHGGDRAALARLRRSANPIETLFEPATHDLVRRLRLSADHRRIGRAGVIAHVLAHVRGAASDPGSGRLMCVLGWTSADPKAADSALLKPLRLRRLLAAETDADLARDLRRAVQMAGQHAIDVGHLGASIFFWGEKTRIEWAFDYYHVADIARPRDQRNELPAATGATAA